MDYPLSDMAIDGNLEAVTPDDAELVARCRAGDARAFTQIVTRYQSLICALTYCKTGNVHQSEDLAQETFLAAWSNLPQLRAPEKLRPWLCGIARNLALNRDRDNRREPTHAAESLDNIASVEVDRGDPAALAMGRDEAALVWRALEQLPETYREPLVLYYRQHQSIEHVAVALDLSEATVRQRLSRGREMLQGRVLAIVERSLGRTSPGHGFTADVMAAITALKLTAGKTIASATGTTAATAGAATVKSVAAGSIKSTVGASTTWLMGTVFWPIAGLFVGWKSAKEGVRSIQSKSKLDIKTSLPSFKNRRELWTAIGVRFVLFATTVFILHEVIDTGAGKKYPILNAAAYTLLALNMAFQDVVKDLREMWRLTTAYLPDSPPLKAAALVSLEFGSVLVVVFCSAYFGSDHAGWCALCVLILSFLLAAMLRVVLFGKKTAPATISATATGEETHPLESTDWSSSLVDLSNKPATPYEYRSRWKLLGFPLVHINTGTTAEGNPRVAKGWLAIGSRAQGIVAIGGVALGVFSMGIAAFGVISIGGIAIGATLAFGGLAAGFEAQGGVALGYQAAGGIALAWHTASGGLAIAHDVVITNLSEDDWSFPPREIFQILWKILLLALVYLWQIKCIIMAFEAGNQKHSGSPMSPKEKIEARKIRQTVMNAQLRPPQLVRRMYIKRTWPAALACGCLIAAIASLTGIFTERNFASHKTLCLLLDAGAFVLIFGLATLFGHVARKGYARIQREAGIELPEITGARWVRAGVLLLVLASALVTFLEINDFFPATFCFSILWPIYVLFVLTL